MKLGEIKAERAVDVIADLIAPIANIAVDFPNFRVTAEYKNEGESNSDMAIRAFKEKVPELLKTHKSDVLSILCTINEKEPEDLSVVDIIKGMIDLTHDPDFMSLFLSAVRTGGKTQPTESSEDVDNSEPES